MDHTHLYYITPYFVSEVTRDRVSVMGGCKGSTHVEHDHDARPEHSTDLCKVREHEMVSSSKNGTRDYEREQIS